MSRVPHMCVMTGQSSHNTFSISPNSFCGKWEKLNTNWLKEKINLSPRIVWLSAWQNSWSWTKSWCLLPSPFMGSAFLCVGFIQAGSSHREEKCPSARAYILSFQQPQWKNGHVPVNNSKKGRGGSLKANQGVAISRKKWLQHRHKWQMSALPFNFLQPSLGEMLVYKYVFQKSLRKPFLENELRLSDNFTSSRYTLLYIVMLSVSPASSPLGCLVLVYLKYWLSALAFLVNIKRYPINSFPST